MSLTNSQYQQIMREYEITRDANRHLLEERREQVYLRIPEMQELDASVGTLATRRLQELLDREEGDLSAPVSESPFPAISARRKALLRAAGYPEDYLEPIYDCRDCRDTGYLSLPDGTKEKCTCLRNREIACLYEQINLQGISPDDCFARLTYRYHQGEELEKFQKIVQTCLNFVRNFDAAPGQNLLFLGTVGTGKSFLSGCIANELLAQGYSVVYFSAKSFFETLAHYSFSSDNKETLYNYCKDLYNYDLVIVDDLGTELPNSFVSSQFFAFLNERALRHKSTVISTNLSLEQLQERYSDRIFSRLFVDFEVLKFSGPDLRIAQKLGQ